MGVVQKPEGSSMNSSLKIYLECALCTIVFSNIKEISPSLAPLDPEKLVKHQVPSPE